MRELPVGDLLHRRHHLARGVDPRDLDPRPAPQGREGKVAGPDPDVEQVAGAIRDDRVEPIQQGAGAGRQDRRPVPLVARRHPVEALTLVGHAWMVPRRPPAGRVSSRAPRRPCEGVLSLPPDAASPGPSRRRRGPTRPARRTPHVTSRTMTPRTTRIGSHTMTNQIPALVSDWRTLIRLADASSTIAVGIPGLLRDLDRHDRDLVGRGQRREVRPVLDVLELGGERLDLAADLGQLVLHLEHVRDPDRLRGDVLEGRLARLQVPDPRLKVDDRAGHLDRLGPLGHDLRRLAVEAAEQVQRILPAIDRDAVGDRGDGSVVLVVGVGGPDVAAERPDAVTRRRQGGRDVLDLEVDAAGADDPGIVDRSADAVAGTPLIAPLAGPVRRWELAPPPVTPSPMTPPEVSPSGYGPPLEAPPQAARTTVRMQDGQRRRDDRWTDGAHLSGPP